MKIIDKLTATKPRIYLVCLAVLVVCMAWKVAHYEGNVTSLLNVGEKWSHFEEFEDSLAPNTVILTESTGYDTFTFYYLIARDPFFQRDEWKSVKYQRWFYPFLAWAFAFGQESLLPWSMVLIQLLAALWVCYELLVFLEEKKLSRAWALWGTLSCGMILSVLYLLTEPLSFALILWAWRHYRQERIGWVALALCLAVWTRESSMVFVAAFAFHAFWHRRWLSSVVMGLSFLPVLFWNILIGPLTELGKPPFLSSSSSFGLPFVGFFEQLALAYREQGAGFWIHDFLIAPYALLMLAACGLAWRGWWRHHDLASLIVLAFGLQGILFLRPMWEGMFAISRLETGLVLAFIFLPTTVRQNFLYKFCAWGWGFYIFLALVRCLRFPENLLVYRLSL